MLTDDGRAALGAWWEASGTDDPPPRDELVLKVLFAVGQGTDHALRVVTYQRTALLGLLWNMAALVVYGLRDLDLGAPSPLLAAAAFTALGFLPAVVVDSALWVWTAGARVRRARLITMAGTGRTEVIERGFEWKFGDLEGALRDCLS